MEVKFAKSKVENNKRENDPLDSIEELKRVVYELKNEVEKLKAKK